MDEKEFSILIRFLKPNIEEGHFFMSIKFIQIQPRLEFKCGGPDIRSPKKGGGSVQLDLLYLNH